MTFEEAIAKLKSVENTCYDIHGEFRSYDDDNWAENTLAIIDELTEVIKFLEEQK
jgi:hypothetical protein